MIINKYLIFGGVIFVLLLLIFLFEKYKSYPEYLTIVPNSLVAVKVRPKKYYDISNPTNFGVFNTTTPPVILKDYKNLSNNNPSNVIVPHSGINDGINNIQSGTDYKLFIYNPGVDSFNIVGVTLEVINKGNGTKINMTIGPKDIPSLVKPYKGDKISIPIQNEIAFINTSGFVLNRIIIICENVTPRPLYIYLKNTSNQYYGIKVADLTNTILVINLFA